MFIYFIKCSVSIHYLIIIFSERFNENFLLFTDITDEILVSQGFIFLLAGFDPLKSALAMLLVELCQNKMIMDRVKEEVATCVNKYNGFTWQAIKEMQYLDWCLSGL